MDNIIKETEFATYHYFSAKKLFIYEFKSATERMTTEQFQEFILETRQLSGYLKPHYIIGNALNQLFIVDPGIQQWVVTQLGTEWSGNGLKKYAHIIASDFVAGLSAEQTVRTNNEIPNTFEIKLLKSMQEALDWIGIDKRLDVNPKELNI